MGEVISFRPDQREQKESVRFPSITEMYSRLERLRRDSSGTTSVPGIGTDGEVTIDQNFGKISNDIQNEIEYSSHDNSVDPKKVQDYVGSMENRMWREDGTLRLAKMEELLHFNFGELEITLEGRPIYHLRDYHLGNPPRATVRHLGDSDKEVNNPSYTFSISEKGGQNFRVEVSPDGNIKILDPNLEDVYKDAETGKRTHKGIGSKAVKGKPRTSLQYEDVEVPLGRLEAFFSGKKTKTVKRRIEDKVEEDIYYRVPVANELVGGPRIERELSPERPHKTLIAKNLLNMLQEGLKNLEKNADIEGKLPSLK